MNNSETVTFARLENLGVITLNRPHDRNALGPAEVRALNNYLDSIEKDSDIRALIVTGSGNKCFCAGGDIKDFVTHTGLEYYNLMGNEVKNVFRRLGDLPKVTVAAINGDALGGGAEIILATDLRVMSAQARLGFPEIVRGMFPGAGGTQRLIRQIGLCKAKELLMLGNTINAAEAQSLGLVNKVVPPDLLMEESLNIARALVNRPTQAIKMLKASISVGLNSGMDAAIKHDHALISMLFDSDEFIEGCNAFIEKRIPSFGVSPKD